MAADPIALQRIKRTGLGALTPSQGLEALEALLLTRCGFDHLAQAAAVSVEWSVVLKVRDPQDQLNHTCQLQRNCFLASSWLIMGGNINLKTTAKDGVMPMHAVQTRCLHLMF